MIRLFWYTATKVLSKSERLELPSFFYPWLCHREWVVNYWGFCNARKLMISLLLQCVWQWFTSVFCSEWLVLVCEAFVSLLCALMGSIFRMASQNVLFNSVKATVWYLQNQNLIKLPSDWLTSIAFLYNKNKLCLFFKYFYYDFWSNIKITFIFFINWQEKENKFLTFNISTLHSTEVRQSNGFFNKWSMSDNYNILYTEFKILG